MRLYKRFGRNRYEDRRRHNGRTREIQSFGCAGERKRVDAERVGRIARTPAGMRVLQGNLSRIPNIGSRRDFPACEQFHLSTGSAKLERYDRAQKTPCSSMV